MMKTISMPHSLMYAQLILGDSRITKSHMRAIYLLMANINPFHDVSDYDDYEHVYMSLKELIAMSCLKSKSIEKEMSDVLFSLIDAAFITEGFGGKQEIKLISRVEFVDEDIVCLTLTKEFTKKMCNVALSEGYTTIPLDYLFQLKSRYSQIMLGPLLTQLSFKCRTEKVVRRFSVEDIRELLHLGEKYKSIRELKQNVINPIVKQINYIKDFQISVETVKSRGKVTDIGKLKNNSNKLVVAGFRFTISNKTYQKHKLETKAKYNKSQFLPSDKITNWDHENLGQYQELK
ncbi:replication initiation protein [Ferrimonas balearica]|uniref:replication initiation protein n=1 Tax=Ferrimonas balearica TaxID=44012 RepID=UPI001C56BE2D|nr:replication initiation protein [Ferrimonas balearica]MBW3139513.1 replication initiation protein [Ferrimonas balearica]